MKKTILRSISALLLALAIVVTQVPVPKVYAVSAEAFRMNGNTLVKYAGQDLVPIIPDGTKKIAEEAFADSGITGVTIPSSVTEIAFGAFTNCSALENITIPDSVYSIGASAFSECPKLGSVNLGSGVTKLGNGIFTGDTALSGINISADNPNFLCTDGVIYSKDMTAVVEMLPGRAVSDYTMPATIKDIYPYAFWGVAALKNLVISNNLKQIPPYAFTGCIGLRELLLPFSTTAIDLKAFEGATNLVNLYIPESVVNIHDSAFDLCPNLHIVAQDMTYASDFAKAHGISTSPVPKNLDPEPEPEPEIIEQQQDDAAQTSQSISEGGGAYNLIKGPIVDYGKDISQDGELASTRIVSGNAVLMIPSGEVSLQNGVTVEKAEKKADGELKTDSTTIFPSAYYKDKALSEYDFSEVLVIREYAFARSGLSYANLPDSIKYIGYAAFYHCDSLMDINIPDTVGYVGDYAFSHTPWLQSFYDGGDAFSQYGDFLIVGDGNLIAYRGDAEILTIPKSVKRVTAEAFLNHTEIQKVYIPDSVKEVSDDAFKGCSSLTDINGGNADAILGDYAFSDTSIHITDDEFVITNNEYLAAGEIGSINKLYRKQDNTGDNNYGAYKAAAFSLLCLGAVATFMLSRKKRH